MPQNLPITLRVALDAEDAGRVIVQWLREYATAVGRPRFVVGLSGGIDSAVSAVLGAEAVGREHVWGLMLPEASTPQEDLTDGEAAARRAGIAADTVPIQPLLDAFVQTTPMQDRAVLANAKARLRMIILHAEAARRQALVLGTGNKSELLTGYFTKFGDGGVDVQPLGDLYKTQVRQLAEHLDIPQSIRGKPPTAGLFAGQTDEAELGITYDRLDRVLLGLEIHLAPSRIAEIVGVAEAEVRRIERLRQATQHKRRSPLSPKIGLRTPGLDWRAATVEG